MQYLCTCGCFVEEHREGGLCLHTLECLCQGYAGLVEWLEGLVEEPLPAELIDVLTAWIRAQRAKGEENV